MNKLGQIIPDAFVSDIKAIIGEARTQAVRSIEYHRVQMYVNYYDRSEKLPSETPTIGILLCASKNNEMVKMALPQDNQTILASQYKLYLPTESQLLAELKKEFENEYSGRGEDHFTMPDIKKL